MAYQGQNYFQKRTKPKGPKANERIRAPQVQVISSDGKNLGTLDTREAINIAKREGLDLIYVKPVSVKEALIGFSFDLNHLSGKTYRINNKDGKVITDDYKKVVNFMGMKRERPHPASPVVGQLIIKFKIKFPETLTDEQKKAIEDSF